MRTNPSSSVHQVGGPGQTTSPLHMHRYNYDARQPMKRRGKGYHQVPWAFSRASDGTHHALGGESLDFKATELQNLDKSPANQMVSRKKEEEGRGCSGERPHLSGHMGHFGLTTHLPYMCPKTAMKERQMAHDRWIKTGWTLKAGLACPLRSQVFSALDGMSLRVYSPRGTWIWWRLWTWTAWQMPGRKTDGESCLAAECSGRKLLQQHSQETEVAWLRSGGCGKGQWGQMGTRFRGKTDDTRRYTEGGKWLRQTLQVPILPKEATGWIVPCHSGLESHTKGGFVRKCTRYGSWLLLLTENVLSVYGMYDIFINF